jgi:hypothetical protein
MFGSKRKVKMSRFVLVLALILSLVGCSWLKSAPVQQAGQAIVNCGDTAVQAVVSDLAAPVAVILGAVDGDWLPIITALEKVGVPAVICAVDAMITAAENHSVAAATQSVAAQRIVARGQAYLASKRVKIVGRAVVP